MKQYNLIIFLSFLLVVSNMKSHAQTATATTTTTTTTTKDGKTYTTTSSASSNPAQASTIVVTGRPTDTTNWKFKEISKDFSIGKATPIYIESINRNIEVKTWDQPNVRIVARAKYTENRGANISFDELFENSGVKIKNTEQAFEILGTAHKNVIFEEMNSISSSIPSGVSFSSPGAIGFSNSRGTSFGNVNSINITSPNFFHSENGDTIMFNKDGNATNLRVLLQTKNKIAKENTEREIAEVIATKQNVANKKKIEALSKQLETLSIRLAALSMQDATKNNKELTKINQEISKISNQIAFQSLGNNLITIKTDSLQNKLEHVQVKALKLNWDKGESFGSGNNVSFTSNYKTDLKWTIYIPKDNKISIDSKYGDITLDNDIETAKILSKYGNVETKNIQNLVVRNEYGNIYTGNVTNADVELRSGKLKMQNITNLKIESKNANIDLDEVGNIKVESSNDNYDVSSIQNLDANKSYGIFRLTTLSGKMNFSGVNADIKIRNISPSTTNIYITNKFANISLPLTDLKNYNIAVNGSFNNSFDDFSIVNKNEKGFSATKGNGKNLNTNINCNNCQLDFK